MRRVGGIVRLMKGTGIEIGRGRENVRGTWTATIAPGTAGGIEITNVTGRTGSNTAARAGEANTGVGMTAGTEKEM